MALQMTAEQQAIIENRGGELLVSAAAGSGKTRVLVERVIRRIVDEGKNIDEFLIITFTRAAAAELRARIGQEISRAISENPSDAHLKEQMLRLYRARIGTIDSFCADLLRQYGHTLDIPADFILCSDADRQLIRQQVLDTVLDSRYVDIDPEGEFAALLEMLESGRDDSGLSGIVLDIFEKIQGCPRPQCWLEEQKAAYSGNSTDDFAQSPWAAALRADGVRMLRYHIGRLEAARELAKEEPVLDQNYGGQMETVIDFMLSAIEQLEAGWPASGCFPIKFPEAGRKRSPAPDAAIKNSVTDAWQAAKKAAETLHDRFFLDEDAYHAMMDGVAPAMRALVDLIADFSDAFSKEKRQYNLLDFSDISHEAVRLLCREDGSPTQTAVQIGRQFTEIMVDEYQDTNEVQNAIFRAISDEGRNLFMVGDVKQSIYRFRLADPGIFLEKMGRFKPYREAEPGEARKIIMSRNFRSRPEVLEAANAIFRNIMSTELGEMDYIDEQALNPGGTFPEGGDYRTELHILDFSGDPSKTEDGEDNMTLEARFVAGKIAQMLKDGFPVSDGEGGLRPVEPDDIVILLRSPGTAREAFIDALERESVSWSAPADQGLFETTEIRTALSWLRIIDNPRQDIPLLAVLRSPTIGFSGQRLAEIRCCSREGDFYHALRTAAAREDADFSDCAAFLEKLDRFRFDAGEKSTHQILRDLYRDTGMLEIFSAMEGGAQRRERLMRFYDLALGFENSGRMGLFSFLCRIETMQENLGKQPGQTSGAQAVRIMSIHGSKGLEFPVVFLCGLGKGFNARDEKKPVLFHLKYGLGTQVLNRKEMLRTSTPLRDSIAMVSHREMLAEEMRLLYVAMTRAKDKLVMVATQGNKKSLKSIAESVSLPAKPAVLEKCNSLGAWILHTAMLRPEAECLWNVAGESVKVSITDGGPQWVIQHHSGAVSGEVMHGGATVSDRDSVETEKTAEIVANLAWHYPHRDAAYAPAKYTATAIVRQAGEEDAENGMPMLSEDSPDRPILFSRPRFGSARGLSPAEKGTALHKVMQCIRLDRTGTVEEVHEELKRLEEGRFLTKEEAASVRAEHVVAFFASPVGRELLRSETLNREYPFSLLTGEKSFLRGIPEGEQVFLQGVIDCWFELDGKITLIDFKTDRVSVKDAREKAEHHRPQLEVYDFALREITGHGADRKLIWFLQIDDFVEL